MMKRALTTNIPMNLFVDFQKFTVQEKIKELNEQHKEQREGEGPRNITQEFALRCTLRDLNNKCRVSVLCRAH
jgi:hypothetical protein